MESAEPEVRRWLRTQQPSTPPRPSTKHAAPERPLVVYQQQLPSGECASSGPSAWGGSSFLGARKARQPVPGAPLIALPSDVVAAHDAQASGAGRRACGLAHEQQLVVAAQHVQPKGLVQNGLAVHVLQG